LQFPFPFIMARKSSSRTSRSKKSSRSSKRTKRPTMRKTGVRKEKKKRSRKNPKTLKKVMKGVSINGGSVFEGVLKESDIYISNYLSIHDSDDLLLDKCKKLLGFFYEGKNNQLIKTVIKGKEKYYTFYIHDKIKKIINPNFTEIIENRLSALLKDYIKNKIMAYNLNIKLKLKLELVKLEKPKITAYLISYFQRLFIEIKNFSEDK